MLKPVLKWMLAIISGIIVVVVILSLFMVVAVPIKSELSDYFADFYRRNSEKISFFNLPEDDQTISEEWVTPLTELPHCEFSISGKITMNDGSPIQDAEVKIFNTGIFNSGAYRYTNQNGSFNYSEIGIETCEKEQFYVAISKNGYEPYFVMATPDQEINVSLTFYGSY
ncbi:MAG: carboxypeptidase-like regulatory domain-containing protein [Gammaproteobacteria bacterium]|jgi:hypothetical protein